MSRVFEMILPLSNTLTHTTNAVIEDEGELELQPYFRVIELGLLPQGCPWPDVTHKDRKFRPTLHIPSKLFLMDFQATESTSFCVETR